MCNIVLTFEFVDQINLMVWPFKINETSKIILLRGIIILFSANYIAK